MTLSKYTANRPITHGYQEISNKYHIIEYNLAKKYAIVIPQKKITGWYIYELRKIHELSQKQVAYRAGVTQAQYSKYEKGKDQLSNEMLIRIANVFATTIEYISGLKRDRDSKESAVLKEEKEIYLKRIMSFYKNQFYPDNVKEEDLEEDAKIYEENLRLINNKINSAIKLEMETITLKNIVTL